MRAMANRRERTPRATSNDVSACVVPAKAGDIKSKMEIIKIKNILELKNILKE